MRLAGNGWRRCVRLGSVLAALALALLAALVGCGSDPANPTGSGLSGDLPFGALLVPLRADSLTDWGRLDVVDPNVPIGKQQVLYMGQRGTERSSILVRYDFANPIDTIPAGLAITAENILSVRIRLFALAVYKQPKLYRVFTLPTPLDSTLYAGAQPPPEPAAGDLIVSQYATAGPDVELDLRNPDLFVQWYQQGTPNGIMIAEGDTTPGVARPGLVGYGSKEMAYPASTIASDLGAGTVVGPILKVEFKNPSVTIRWQALYDVSSYASLDPLPTAPDEGPVVRTGLRSYPYLSFDLGRLPAGVFINRAVLVLTGDPDTMRSYGPLGTIVCGELPAAAVRAARVDSSYQLDSLRARVRVATARTSVNPDSVGRFELDVTLSIQRQANGVYASPIRFLLFSDERFTAYNTGGPAPDFYLRRYHFLGTAAPDPEDRPHLQITYTRPGSLGGGSP
jgi:hypothetical protein